MNKHVLSVLVYNHSGVLSRVSGLFSRRGYNIDSLTVGSTHKDDISRMTIVVSADDQILEQIKKQLNKLIDVIKVEELKCESSVFREIALIKVNTSNNNRSAIIEIVNIFRANIIDVASESIIIEITGTQNKINSFIKLLDIYGIIEIVRTGLTALERGCKELGKKFEEEKKYGYNVL